MKTALFIHSFARVNDIVARHWPFWKLTGFPIFGVDRIGGGCRWPEPIPSKQIGYDNYISGDNLPRRLTDTFRWFLQDPIFKDFTHACVIEYDAIFLRSPPFTEDMGVAAQRAGGPIPPMRAQNFYHCPWILSRDCAETFVDYADQLLARGECECGNPDFFFGVVWQDLGIPVIHLEGTYTQNTVLAPQHVEEARRRVASGELWFIHGIKSSAVLYTIVPHPPRLVNGGGGGVQV